MFLLRLNISKLPSFSILAINFSSLMEQTPNKSISIEFLCPICRDSAVPPTKLKSLNNESDIIVFSNSNNSDVTVFECSI